MVCSNWPEWQPISAGAGLDPPASARSSTLMKPNFSNHHSVSFGAITGL